MAEPRSKAAGSGEHAGRTAPLPDLTGVDLRTLRAMDDPGLSAAVEQVLRSSCEVGQAWYSTGDDPVRDGAAPAERMFPVGSGAVVRGEESRG